MYLTRREKKNKESAIKEMEKKMKSCEQGKLGRRQKKKRKEKEDQSQVKTRTIYAKKGEEMKRGGKGRLGRRVKKKLKEE